MRKGIVIAVAVLLTVIVGLVVYSYVWGGSPQLDDFDSVSEEYEEIAETALLYYKNSSPEEESIIISINETGLTQDGENLQLSDSQIAAVKIAYDKFDFLRVYEDAVFFYEDETGYYGLVYSQNPVSALYKAELPQAGREYHRINSSWYEWGVFGI